MQTSRSLSNPIAWPRPHSMCIFRAKRLFPSMIMAMCFGIAPEEITYILKTNHLQLLWRRVSEPLQPLQQTRVRMIVVSPFIIIKYLYWLILRVEFTWQHRVIDQTMPPKKGKKGASKKKKKGSKGKKSKLSSQEKFLQFQFAPAWFLFSIF